MLSQRLPPLVRILQREETDSVVTRASASQTVEKTQSLILGKCPDSFQNHLGRCTLILFSRLLLLLAEFSKFCMVFL